MSRSYRHESIAGNTCAESEKKDKRRCNKKMRRLAKMFLAKSHEDFLMPLKGEILDKWMMAKDGMNYFDKNEFPQFMRK